MQDGTARNNDPARIAITPRDEAGIRAENARERQALLLVGEAFLRQVDLLLRFHRGGAGAQQVGFGDVQLLDGFIHLGLRTDFGGDQIGNAFVILLRLLFHGSGASFIHAHAVGSGFGAGQGGFSDFHLPLEFAVIKPREQLTGGHVITLIDQHLGQTLLNARAEDGFDARLQCAGAHDFGNDVGLLHNADRNQGGGEVEAKQYRTSDDQHDQPFPVFSHDIILSASDDRVTDRFTVIMAADSVRLL
ncbi:MAG: hypothetical protein V9H26_05975 [Verrucomicrobiota bacterium]